MAEAVRSHFGWSSVSLPVAWLVGGSHSVSYQRVGATSFSARHRRAAQEGAGFSDTIESTTATAIETMGASTSLSTGVIVIGTAVETDTVTKTGTVTNTDTAACTIPASNFDQSCTVDSDCVVVMTGNYCGGCPCDAFGAISVSALDAFDAAIAQTPVGSGAFRGIVVCSCPEVVGPAVDKADARRTARPRLRTRCPRAPRRVAAANTRKGAPAARRDRWGRPTRAPMLTRPVASQLYRHPHSNAGPTAQSRITRGGEPRRAASLPR